MSSVSPEEVLAAQGRLADLKAAQAFQKRVSALVNTREFKEIIIDGFCRDNVARLVHQTADPALSAEQRADALSMAQAGGHLLRWLSVGETQSEIIGREIAELEEALLIVAHED